MKKFASVLASIALAVGLMVPTVAMADESGTVAIEYNGQRINLQPQISEDAHSLNITFGVQTDDTKYQSYVSAGFTLSSEARSARIAQSNVTGNTVTAVISNGESPLAFSNNVFFLGTLTVNVDAKLDAGDSTAARIVVSTMDTTDQSFGMPIMYTMDTRDDDGDLLSVEARTTPFTLATTAFTGTAVPDPDASGDGFDTPGGSGSAGGGTGGGDLGPSYVYDPDNVISGSGELASGVSVSETSLSGLQTLGADIIQAIYDGATGYTGLTAEQVAAIAAVIQAAGDNIDDLVVSVNPVANQLEATDVPEDIAMLDKLFSGAYLLTAYDLSVTFSIYYDATHTETFNLTELASPIEVTLSVPNNYLSYLSAAVGFVHEGQAGAITSGVIPSAKNSTVTFPASLFSTYAVYGKVSSPTPNGGTYGSALGQTGDDKAMLMVAFAGVALIASIAVVFTGRKRKLR